MKTLGESGDVPAGPFGDHTKQSRVFLEDLEPRILLTAYTVTSLADTVAADGFITLREALEAANTNARVYDAPAGSDIEADEIVFDAALFSSGPATLTLSGTQLDITDDLTLTGPGADLLTIDAAQSSRARDSVVKNRSKKNPASRTRPRSGRSQPASTA